LDFLSNKEEFMFVVFSYLAKFLGSLDSQYETLFGSNELSNEISGNKNTQYMTRIVGLI
jgi:hypothetical protein